MASTWRITNLIVLGLLILVSFLGTFYKHISFGMGLGDMFGYAWLYLTTIVHLILTLVSRKKGPTRHRALTIVFFTMTIWICLKATLLRGSEYRWNGSIFYLPCPTEVKIINRNLDKTLLIRMCTMEYNSEFKATWDGKYMKIEEGELRIPPELKEFLDYPIDIVEIEPEPGNQIIGGSVAKARFLTDTLRINTTYNLQGEIIRISNSRPVVQVIIKK